MHAIVCEYCDSIYAKAALPARGTARCTQCDALLYRSRIGRVDKMLALSIAAAVAFVLGTTMPLMTLTVNGAEIHATLWDAVMTSYDRGLTMVAVIAASTLFVFPLLEISLYLWILLPLRARRVPPQFVTAMHILRYLRPWSMVEVFMLGVVVAIMKLSSIASVRPEPGVVGFALLTLALIWLASFDRRELWDRADEARA